MWRRADSREPRVLTDNCDPAAWRNRFPATRLARFAVVGLFGATLYGVGTGLLHQCAGMALPLAASLSFVLVVATNYVLHYWWTFESDRPHADTIGRFLGMVCGGMTLNYLTLAVGTRWLALPQTMVLSLGMVVVVAWNYGLSRYWVFLSR